MRMSRDVVFDEMSSWYALVKLTAYVDARNDKAKQDEEHQSQVLSESKESSKNGVTFLHGHLDCDQEHLLMEM